MLWQIFATIKNKGFLKKEGIMRLNNYAKTLSIALVGILSAVPSAQALFPTLDVSAIFQNAKSITQQIDQYKTQILESKTVGSINSAIGDAKASMSKFNLDAAKQQLKKAEKAKKALEKVKKIKEDIEKAKAEFEAKKALYEDYKKQLEQAKKDIKDKVDEAKGMYNDAKETVSSASSFATQAVNDTKAKIADVKNDISQNMNKVSNNDSSAKISANAVAPVSSTATNTQPMTTAPSSSSKIQNGRVGFIAPAENNIVTLNNTSVSPTTNASINVPSNTSGRASVTTSSPAMVQTSLSSSPSSIAKVPAQVSAIQGTDAGVKVLSQSVSEAIEKQDIDSLQAISDINESDIINSNSKIYENTEDSKVISEENNLGRKTFRTPSLKAEVEQEKNTVNDRKSGESQETLNTSTSAISQKNTDIEKAALQENSSENKASILAPKDNAIAPTTSGRKAFRPAEKSSFWMDNGEHSRQGMTKLNQIQTLQFADKASECMYNNSIQNGDDGEIVVLSETMAKECCIEADKLTDMKVIKDCANKVLKKMTNSNEEIRKEGTDLYTLISSEQNIFGLVESLEDTKDSAGYFTNVLVPYMKDIKKTESKATTTNDKITSIAMTNAQMLYLLNRIRRIHTSALSTTGFNKMNDVLEKTLNEDTDIGLGEIKGEYASTIVRGVNNNSETSSNEVSLDYPVIPENLAKKCSLKLDADSIARLKECYFEIVQEAHAKDFTERQVGIDFIENIKYQDLLNILAKSLYQKVKSAHYDEELEITKENITGGTTERTNGDGLFKTNYEIQKALDDIVNIYATRIAHSSLENLLQVAPQAAENQNGTEG